MSNQNIVHTERADKKSPIEPLSQAEATVSPEPEKTPRLTRVNFAEGIAAAEFGGRYYGWREWADHVDVEPETLVEKRQLAIWGDTK